jgi:hypothetical protein
VPPMVESRQRRLRRAISRWKLLGDLDVGSGKLLWYGSVLPRQDFLLLAVSKGSRKKNECIN